MVSRTIVIAVKHFVHVTLAGLGGLLVLLGGIILHEQIAGSPRWPTLDLAGHELRTMNRYTETSEDGLKARDPGQEHIVLASLRGVPAERYGRIGLDISGLNPEQSVTLIWSSTALPGKDQARPLSAAERKAGLVDLREDPAWVGGIQAIGLSIDGPSHETVAVKRLTLRPEPPTWRETLESRLDQWRQLGPWQDSSINLYRSSREFAAPSPAATAAIWVTLSGLLYLLILRRFAIPASASALAAFVLIGWLVLDVRWQLELGARLGATYARFGILEPSERLGVAPDKDLRDAADGFRAQLPAEPARIFLISADPQGYRAARLGYHLIPHRVYRGMTELPSSAQARPGDFILLLGPTQEMRYDRERAMLSDPSHTLPAELIAVAPGVGGLFRVQGETAS